LRNNQRWRAIRAKAILLDQPGVYTSPTEAGKITYINEPLTTSDKAF
jgi:hypothetical protein